jgi:hypothetical protein
VVLVMAIFGLAVVGTAGAFGYRAMFGGSVLPTLPPIAKASNEQNPLYLFHQTVGSAVILTLAPVVALP